MQPPQSIEEIKAGLETTEKGGVRQSIRNCLTVFQRDPLLSEAIAYNPDGVINLFLIGKPVGFFQIEKQILHICIVQGGAFPVEADGLYDVLAVS